MMKKFIHLRGAMAAGKTTAARSFANHGNFAICNVAINRKNLPFLFDKERKIVVTGRYDTRECGGLDGVIKDKAEMIKYITQIIKQEDPDYFVFEAVMYGMTVKFTEELCTWLKKYQFNYVGLSLCPPLDYSVQKVFERNGGKQINLEMFCEKYERSRLASERLKAKGYNIKFIDTSKINKQDMWKIIQEEIS